jgi:hypothetical protein
MRGIYLVMGIFVIIQSLWMHQWLGVLFGIYFASMGLFSFGCAAGNCMVNEPLSTPAKKSNIAGEAE